MDNQLCVKDDLQGNHTMPKVIAFYLPQYHEIPENNKWWGQGFTEWTNVKRAKKIFDGQYQPQVPLNNNYYNLMDKETVEWQTELANKYGVYGFCYFHYNFCGKRLLEKPAENLLKWKDIPQRFCFAWANVTWARTWSAVKEGATTWQPAEQRNDGEAQILIKQTYGNAEQWEEHINYLVPFFLDSRYMKVEGKPMFLIYDLAHIPNAVEMFSVWDDIVKRHGIPGIHIVSMNQVFSHNPYVNAIVHYGIYKGIVHSFKATIIRGKRFIVNFLMKMLHSSYRIPRTWDYEFVWETMTNINPCGHVINYPSAFVNYDDTPRRGRDGVFLKNSSPSIFKKYFKIQLQRMNKVFHSEYLFLDAWNEWGEGNHLEPDCKNGYAYLEALNEVLVELQSDERSNNH